MSTYVDVLSCWRVIGWLDCINDQLGLIKWPRSVSQIVIRFSYRVILCSSTFQTNAVCKIDSHVQKYQHKVRINKIWIVNIYYILYFFLLKSRARGRLLSVDSATGSSRTWGSPSFIDSDTQLYFLALWEQTAGSPSDSCCLQRTALRRPAQTGLLRLLSLSFCPSSHTVDVPIISRYCGPQHNPVKDVKRRSSLGETER